MRSLLLASGYLGVKSALKQIEEKQYEAALRSGGIRPERIEKYGFAFEGSKVLIGKRDSCVQSGKNGA